MKNLFMLLAFAAITALSLNSCTPDPCSDLNCQNGVCDDGTCDCDDGYITDSDGECTLTRSTLFEGSYEVGVACNCGATLTYTTNLVAVGTSKPNALTTSVTYDNCGTGGSTTANYEITIDENDNVQVTGTNVTDSGTGTRLGSQITFDIQGGDCTVSLTKQ